MTSLAVEKPDINPRDLAGYLIEARLGTCFRAAGRDAQVGIRVYWAFVGELESAWEFDLSGPFAQIGPATGSPEDYDVCVVWALSVERLVAHVNGAYGLTDAQRDGTLRVLGTAPNRLKFGKALKAMAQADVETFLRGGESFAEQRLESFLANKKRKPARPRVRGVSLRGGQ